MQEAGNFFGVTTFLLQFKEEEKSKMNSILRTNLSIFKSLGNARLYCTSKVPKNATEHLTSAQNQIENGAIYDKKPFKLHLEEGKNYSWCLCGKSKTQPLCDGFHKNVHFKIKQRPVRFQVEKTGKFENEFLYSTGSNQSSILCR
jgi:CDGSH iron-sulfur domain-containing protein 3